MAKETKSKKTTKTAKAKVAKVENKKATPTQGDKIWDMIKNLDLHLFALPGQLLHKKVKRMPIDESCVHLKVSVAAVVPALEEALKGVSPGDKRAWKVVQSDIYTAVELVDIE